MNIKSGTIEEALEVEKEIIEFEDKNERGDYLERFENVRNIILIAYDDVDKVGFVVGYERYDSLYLWLSGVIPAFRGTGIFKELMNKFYEFARENGYIKVTVKTKNKFRPMLTYLIKNGFNIVEVSDKGDIMENKIMLEKQI